MVLQPGFDIGGSVYTGVWRDYSSSPGSVWTITLNEGNGLVLAAFFALFVRFCAAHSWGIGRYLLHRLRATQKQHDGLYHHHQLVLRNNHSSTSTFWRLLELGWAWRRTARRPFLRSLPLLTFTLVHLLLFSVAAIFSTKAITIPSHLVLISDGHCGDLPENDASDPIFAFNKVQLYRSKVTRESSNYARACYEQTHSKWECAVFPQPRLPVIQKDVDCPFNATICRGSAFSVDSGLIDSQRDLGINLPPEDSLKFRKIMTCAPLQVQGYSQNSSASSIPYLQVRYGTRGPDDFTYKYPVFHPNSSDDVLPNLQIFGLGYVVHLQNFEGNDYTPIPELQRNDADVTVVFLSAGNIVHVDKVSDPWFQATNCEAMGYFPSENGTVQRPVCLFNNPINSLGCTEQYQICKSRSSDSKAECTPLKEMKDLWDRALKLNLSKRQSAVAKRFATNAGALDRVLDMGSGALLAADKLDHGMIRGLPNDQWKIEVSHWHNIAMATWQRQFVEYATGPSDPAVYSWQEKTNSTEMTEMCASQKVARDSYRNFSLMRMVGLLALGTLIVILNLSREVIFELIQRKRTGAGDYRRIAWVMDEALQLHRLVQEKAGYGDWTHCAQDVPLTTSSDQLLGLMSLDDPNHPQLVEKLESKESETATTTEIERQRVSVGEQDLPAPVTSTQTW